MLIMKIFFFSILCSSLFLVSCSSDKETLDNDHFILKVDGTQVSINRPNEGQFPGYVISKKGNLISISATFGESFEWFTLKFLFTAEGKLISAKKESYSSSLGDVDYYSYRNFSSNYFNINIISIDEASKQIKVKLNGIMYANTSDLNSLNIDIEADIDAQFQVIENTETNYLVNINDIIGSSNQVEQYCSAKFNTAPWIARHEFSNSSFTNEDPYKIEINFASNALPESFPFTSSSTTNYVKFSKFNTTTLTYDYYDITGVLAHSYREFHGAGNYSFIGTFNFTATNPNNPSDVITVTDGVFRSYQHF